MFLAIHPAFNQFELFLRVFLREICVSLAVRFLTVFPSELLTVSVCCLWCQAGLDGLLEPFHSQHLPTKTETTPVYTCGRSFLKQLQSRWVFSTPFLPDSSTISLACYPWNYAKRDYLSSASRTEASLSLPFCLPGQQQVPHSHNGAATTLGQTPVLHLKAYLTFHSSIHRLRTLRLWARPRLASGRQCPELKATHGSSLGLGVPKHTSRARNSWPLFLTHKERPGIRREGYGAGFRVEPEHTKVLKERTRQMVVFCMETPNWCQRFQARSKKTPSLWAKVGIIHSIISLSWSVGDVGVSIWRKELRFSLKCNRLKGDYTVILIFTIKDYTF